ncbi:MAG: DUF4365 domain-containing protein [Gemmataceae bacterium]|nr:DUF4365 domain-containing protein [Gemmataceae bacterium]
MDFCGRRQPYFRPRFLGEKARTLDFLVDLVGTSRPRHFFAQVKSTRKELTKKERRLRVGMSASDLRRAAAVPGPTYLIGVDERGERCYLFPILDGMSDALSSIPTAHPLDCANLPNLHHEVERYWDSRDMRRRVSVFAV